MDTQSAESPSTPPAAPSDLSHLLESTLHNLQLKFEQMSSQIVSKMDEMGSRIDDLEKSIGDLVTQQSSDDDLRLLTSRPALAASAEAKPE